MSDESPFFIEQTAVIEPNRSVSMSFLDNLVREKWDLHEIRLVVTPVEDDGVTPSAPNDGASPATARMLGLATMLDFGLRLQSTYLTVPRTVPAEILRSPFFDSLAPAETPTIPDFNAPAVRYQQNSLIWVFPEPLFVPAGAKMYGEAAFNAAEGANGFLWDFLQLRATLIGNRTSRPMPEKSKIPYATAFRTVKEAIGVGGHVQEFRAQDFQLQNHCDETLFVQRLTAHNVADARMPTSIRYSTSEGKFINRELAPLLELHSNGALNLHTVLKKNEFIAVEGEIDSRPTQETIVPVGSLATTPIANTFEQQAIFGLVGYREVDTVALWGPALINPVSGEPVHPRAPPMLPYTVNLPEVNSRMPGNPPLPWPKPRGPSPLPLPRRK